MKIQGKKYLYIAERNFYWQDLARFFGYHPQYLRQANEKLGNYVLKGEEVQLPYKGCGAGIFYKTLASQTLLQLCDGLGMTPEHLLSYNPGLWPHKVCNGQTLLLPADIQSYRNAKIVQKQVGDASLGECLFAAKMTLELLELLNPDRDILHMQKGDLLQMICWEVKQSPPTFYDF